MKKLTEIQKVIEREHVAYCSRCKTTVKVFEDDKIIRCLSCGHTSNKSDIQMKSGKEILKWLKDGGRIDVTNK